MREKVKFSLFSPHFCSPLPPNLTRASFTSGAAADDSPCWPPVPPHVTFNPSPPFVKRLREKGLAFFSHLKKSSPTNNNPLPEPPPPHRDNEITTTNLLPLAKEAPIINFDMQSPRVKESGSTEPTLKFKSLRVKPLLRSSNVNPIWDVDFEPTEKSERVTERFWSDWLVERTASPKSPGMELVVEESGKLGMSGLKKVERYAGTKGMVGLGVVGQPVWVDAKPVGTVELGKLFSPKPSGLVMVVEASVGLYGCEQKFVGLIEVGLVRFG